MPKSKKEKNSSSSGKSEKDSGTKAPEGQEKSKIVLDLFGSEILEREVSKFGTGAHVIIPKEHIGKKIKIIVEGEDE